MQISHAINTESYRFLQMRQGGPSIREPVSFAQAFSFQVLRQESRLPTDKHFVLRFLKFAGTFTGFYSLVK